MIRSCLVVLFASSLCCAVGLVVDDGVVVRHLLVAVVPISSGILNPRSWWSLFYCTVSDQNIEQHIPQGKRSTSANDIRRKSTSDTHRGKAQVYRTNVGGEGVCVLCVCVE